MSTTNRIWAAALAATVAIGCAAVAALAPEPALARAGLGQPAGPSADTVRRTRDTWAHEASDLAPDPSVRFGTLPNGMRYALMRNATPPGQAALRLRIDAGSLMEADDQLGLAHFIEHMAFNGSTDIPEGELIRILERLGLAFGPDTNAFTSFDQTVYQLDLPRTDEETVETGLRILRQMAGEATLAADAIDRERGVVLSEERTRDTPALRVARARYDFLMAGQLAARRFPIGQAEILAGAPQPRFAAFYEAYYRPERATLVAVGDFDLDEMEARIRARFADWVRPGPDGAEPDLGPVRPRGAEAAVAVEPGAPATLQLAWVSPPDLSPDTAEKRRRGLLRQLALAVLNRRFERLARGAAPPFIAAGASRYTQLDSQDVAGLSASFRPGAWRPALEALEQEQRRIVEHGVSQAEVDREVTELRTALQAYVAGAATRRTPSLANLIIGAVNDGEVVTAPQAELARFEAVVEGLSAETVSAVLREVFQGHGPLVFVATPAPIEGGEAAVLAALEESRAQAVEAPAARDAQAWSYDDFGPAGEIVERGRLEDIDVTLVRFANGVRLTVKPTDFRDDQVLVAVNVGDGRLGLPADPAAPIWAAPLGFVEGGLGRLTAEEMEEVLASRVYGANLSVSDETLRLSGSTRPEDLTVQLQVLAAYVADPGWRAEPFERARTLYANAVDQLGATPGGVFSRDGRVRLYGGDPRWGFPAPEHIAAARPEALRALLEPQLAEGPLEVVIVGDVEPEAAIAAAAATFGALPARPDAAPVDPASARVAFPAPTATPARLTHTGRADQGMGFMAWPTADTRSDLHRGRVLSLLAGVLRLRLTDELREGQAVTYSPSASSYGAWSLPGYGYVSAAIEAPPERLDGFFADVERIVADLRDQPVDADELERARRPVIEGLLQVRAGNEYWLGQLERIHTDAVRLESIRTVVEDVRAITAEELQAAARQWLTPDRAWRLVVVPEAR